MHKVDPKSKPRTRWQVYANQDTGDEHKCICEFVKSFITWKFLFFNHCWYHCNWKWTILIRLHFNAFDTKYCIWRGYNSYFLNFFVIKHKLYLQMMLPTTASSKTLSYICNQWLLFIQDMNTVYCKQIFSNFFYQNDN